MHQLQALSITYARLFVITRSIRRVKSLVSQTSLFTTASVLTCWPTYNVSNSRSALHAPDRILHENTQEWLQSTAKLILQGSIMPVESINPHYSMHRSFLYTAFLYHDLSSRGHRSARLPIHRSIHQGNGRQSCQGLD